MPTMITADCINCGNCARECPNDAVYAGGEPWTLHGQSHPPQAEDVFYIVRVKCTDCAGFFAERQCAAVCPVDCCVPDPDALETVEELLLKAKRLHPDCVLPDDASAGRPTHGGLM